MNEYKYNLEYVGTFQAKQYFTSNGTPRTGYFVTGVDYMNLDLKDRQYYLNNRSKAIVTKDGYLYLNKKSYMEATGKGRTYTDRRLKDKVEVVYLEDLIPMEIITMGFDDVWVYEKGEDGKNQPVKINKFKALPGTPLWTKRYSDLATEKTKFKHSGNSIRDPRKKVHKCYHCKKMMVKSVYTRFHGDACKKNMSSVNYFKYNFWRNYKKHKGILKGQAKSDLVNHQIRLKITPQSEHHLLKTPVDHKETNIYQQWLRLHNLDDRWDGRTMSMNKPGYGTRVIDYVKSDVEMGEIQLFSSNRHSQGNKGPHSGKVPEYNTNHICVVGNDGIITWEEFKKALKAGMNLEPMEVDHQKLVDQKKIDDVKLAEDMEEAKERYYEVADENGWY